MAICNQSIWSMKALGKKQQQVAQQLVTAAELRMKEEEKIRQQEEKKRREEEERKRKEEEAEEKRLKEEEARKKKEQEEAERTRRLEELMEQEKKRQAEENEKRQKEEEKKLQQEEERRQNEEKQKQTLTMVAEVNKYIQANLEAWAQAKFNVEKDAYEHEGLTKLAEPYEEMMKGVVATINEKILSIDMKYVEWGDQNFISGLKTDVMSALKKKMNEKLLEMNAYNNETQKLKLETASATIADTIEKSREKPQVHYAKEYALKLMDAVGERIENERMRTGYNDAYYARVKNKNDVLNLIAGIEKTAEDKSKVIEEISYKVMNLIATIRTMIKEIAQEEFKQNKDAFDNYQKKEYKPEMFDSANKKEELLKKIQDTRKEIQKTYASFMLPWRKQYPKDASQYEGLLTKDFYNQEVLSKNITDGIASFLHTLYRAEMLKFFENVDVKLKDDRTEPLRMNVERWEGYKGDAAKAQKAWQILWPYIGAAIEVQKENIQAEKKKVKEVTTEFSLVALYAGRYLDTLAKVLQEEFQKYAQKAYGEKWSTDAEFKKIQAAVNTRVKAIKEKLSKPSAESSTSTESETSTSSTSTPESSTLE